MSGPIIEPNDLRQAFEHELAQVTSRADLQALRVRYFGKKGKLTGLLAQLGSLSAQDRPRVGALLNQLKQSLETQCNEREKALTAQEISSHAARDVHFDVTAYTPVKRGHLHPYTHVIWEIQEIFSSMGYEIVRGPEVETDYRNFGALNIPANHPARDMYDTFWLNHASLLLRTHTSTMQSRLLESGKLPIACVAPGRVFRHEATDASHDFMFMQCEGFFVGENITLAHLFATTKTFLEKFFGGRALNLRIRPGFFPFVEPGVEIDVECPFCTAGCSVCKKTRWIEVFPGGLIHPEVLKISGIDPAKYSGFAFGFGLTRLVMIKYGIHDIRLMHTGNMRFIEQF